MSDPVKLATVFGPLPAAPPNWSKAARDAVEQLRATGMRSVIGTRDAARELLSLLPPGPVVLDCAYVEMVSTPFFHELLRDREVSIVNANAEITASFEMVAELHA